MSVRRGGVGAVVFSSGVLARAGQLTEGHISTERDKCVCKPVITVCSMQTSSPKTSAALCRAMKQASSPQHIPFFRIPFRKSLPKPQLALMRLQSRPSVWESPPRTALATSLPQDSTDNIPQKGVTPSCLEHTRRPPLPSPRPGRLPVSLLLLFNTRLFLYPSIRPQLSRFRGTSQNSTPAASNSHTKPQLFSPVRPGVQDSGECFMSVVPPLGSLLPDMFPLLPLRVHTGL